MVLDLSAEVATCVKNVKMWGIWSLLSACRFWQGCTSHLLNPHFF